MEGPLWDEADLFRCVETSGARALLIGRQAMIALGLPVLTGDYDFWLHPDDIELFNRALASLDFAPTHSVDAVRVAFDEVWSRREAQRLADGPTIMLPSLDDLISTKRFAARPKDLEDLRLLEILRRGRLP